MPVTKLDPGVSLDAAPTAQVSRLPANVALDAPTYEPTPPTTAPGLAASAARGLAPYAAGAAVGAAAGAPIMGVGAVPGAIAGMGAVGLTQFGGDIYNAVASHLGWPETLTPQAATDKALDLIGIKRPASSAEKMTETAAGTLPMGVTWAGLGDAIAKNSADAAEQFIKTAYNRAIKPPVAAAKGRATGLADYYGQARGAIDSIVANKPALRFADEIGEMTAGELPKNLEQFADSIEQTKQSIFDRYDAMARQAGQAGAAVDLNPAARQLQKIASDPVVGDLHPDLVAYAKGAADRLAQRGAYSASDAQRAIQNLNASLKAFYNNPTYETASRASVDSMIANQLRSGLDKAVESAAGPGYQALKNQYGALKAIEKHVVNRAIVVGRQNAGGGLMGNIGDLMSADEVLRGVLHFNPASVATGGMLKAMTAYVKHLRDPNRAVQKLFEAAERQYPKRSIGPGELPPPAPPLALPPPTVRGPAPPWTSTGSGMIPPNPTGFTTTAPSGTDALLGYMPP